MKPIKESKIFTHELSQKSFATKAGARKDYERILEDKRKEKIDYEQQEYRANYIRLNAESVDHMKELMVKCAKEFWDIDIEFTKFDFYFGLIPNSHNAPVGKQPNWHNSENILGFDGRIAEVIKYKKQKSDCFHTGLYTFIKKINGFHTGTGCPGDGFDITANFFLEDYPLIAAKYQKYLDQKKNKDEELSVSKSEKSVNELEIQSIYERNETVNKNYAEIEDLNIRINNLREQNSSIKQVIVNQNPFKFDFKHQVIDPDLLKMFAR